MPLWQSFARRGHLPIGGIELRHITHLDAGINGVELIGKDRTDRGIDLDAPIVRNGPPDPGGRAAKAFGRCPRASEKRRMPWIVWPTDCPINLYIRRTNPTYFKTGRRRLGRC